VVGGEKLAFLWVCDVDAGHDYSEVLDKGRRLVVVEDYRPRVRMNPYCGCETGRRREACGRERPAADARRPGVPDASLVDRLSCDVAFIAGLMAQLQGSVPTRIPSCCICTLR
jgi:hypothetical protein